jgi:hypothetical protein
VAGSLFLSSSKWLFYFKYTLYYYNMQHINGSSIIYIVCFVEQCVTAGASQYVDSVNECYDRTND